MGMSVFRPWLFTIAAMLSACGQGGLDPERYVLTGNDKNLFFQTQILVDPRKTDRIIAEAKGFAREHGMDLLVARKSLPPGEFNVSVNAATINVTAMHIAAVGDTGVKVFAIVPYSPTQTDKEMVREFVNRLGKIR